MKQGTAVTRAVIIVLLAAVLVYLGVYLWQGLSDPYQLVATYAYEMDDAAALTGVVVRTEEAIPGHAALAEVTPREGERVSAGAQVAAIYQNEEVLLDRRRARNMELELEQVRYAMRRGEGVSDAGVLDSQLVDTLARLKSGVSAGSLDELETRGSELRSLVVKRTSDVASAESAIRLQNTAAELEERLAALNAASAQVTRRVTVDRGGVFSGLADGLESTLTPESLETLTVDGLDRLRRQELAPAEDSLGKLITGSTWYFAADLSEEDAKRVEEGKSYTLAFSGDFNEEITMTLERLGPVENGRRVAVFSSNRCLNQITLCRFLGARLVFERYTGVRIPDKALRVRTEADGATTPGVYTLVGRQAEFKTVEVVREGEGFYLVRGTATNRKVLRPGDTIILSNHELFEGKVVA